MGIGSQLRRNGYKHQRIGEGVVDGFAAMAEQRRAMECDRVVRRWAGDA